MYVVMNIGYNRIISHLGLNAQKKKKKVSHAC